MIIYIYGNDGFKKEIHSVLNHSNIKFRLDDHGEIVDLETLDELKEAIEDNPHNIYLIDDDKIIKKNSLNKKIKFLQPKDAIEQEYLLDHGIGDLSVDSIEELSKHIIRKLEASIIEKESNEIQDSIVEIVEDAYEEDENDYIQLDDELSALLAHEDKEEVKIVEKNDKIDEISSLVTQIDEVNIDDSDIEKLEELSFDEDFDNIIDMSEDDFDEDDSLNSFISSEKNQGENMADEFSEFDNLSENDILDALNGIDNVSVATPVKEIKSETSQFSKGDSSSNSSMELSGSNVNEIAELISKLLNNKTLEITIKIKD